MCVGPLLNEEESSKEHVDILRSEGGGELTPVVVPRSSNSMVYLKRLRPVKYDCSYYFVTRRRLIERGRM